MKRNGIILMNVLLVFSSVSCSSNTKIEYNPSSCLEAIKQLQNVNNFTLEIYNTDLGDRGTIYFNENYYYDILNSYGYVLKNNEVFKFDVDHKGEFIPNEVVKEMGKDIYSTHLVTTFEDIDLYYAEVIDDETVEFNNKDNKIAFLELIGESYSKYTDLGPVTFTFDKETKELGIHAEFASKETYVDCKVSAVNSTVDNELETFRKNASPYIPSTEQSEVRDLIRTNNFTRYIYNDGKELIGKEYFTPTYYVLNYYSNAGDAMMYNNGQVALVDKSYNGTKIENGTYVATISTDEEAIANVFLGHYNFKETNMPSVMNYPSNLQLFNYFNLFTYNEELDINFTQDLILTTEAYYNFGINNAGFTTVALSGLGYKIEKLTNDYVLTINVYGTFDSTFGVFTFELREFGKTAHIGVEKFLALLD